MKNFLPALIIAFLYGFNGFSQTAVSSDENYIFKRIYKSKFTVPITISTTNEVIEEITYLDGLGRPMQHIGIRQAANTQEDIVTHIGYDVYGRENKKYLPFPASASSAGGYRSGDVIGSTKSYYHSNYAADFPNMTTSDTNPYSETRFEASPLNRPLEQGAPGKAWKVDPVANTDRTVKFDYESNAGSEVRLYKVSLSSTFSPSLVQNTSTYYAAGELYKSITKDENWTSGLNNTTEEFKDKQGRVVLKRTYNAGAAHDTYYVYDDFGNLTYVIPPKVLTSDGVSITELNELCYQYHYDKRNRLIRKKIPGKGTATNWESIVYNDLDQPILTQDPNLKAQGKWLYTKYDAFGRVIATGLHTHSASSQSVMQGVVDNYYLNNSSAKVWEEKPGTNLDYSNQSYPTTNNEVLTLNFYDNYHFNDANLKLTTGTWIFDDQVEYTTKGLATGSRVKVLGQAKWITTVNHYNKEGRSIYMASYNDFLQTTDKVKTQLDFMGNVLKTETNHKKGTNTAIVTTDNFTYDHVNRLTKHTQTLNGKTEVIAANIYDKVGMLKTKGVGNIDGGSRLQNVDYTYNIRGWLKQINNPGTLGSDLFGFKINYNTVNHSATPLYNGNISETVWKTQNDNVLRWYRYGYDNLNRITFATANSSNYNVSGISYDKNGNLTNLTRRGAINSTSSSFGNMDVLTYAYYNNGNKLQRVNDTGSATYGFVNGVSQTTEYTYDGNGNMKTDSNKGITAIDYNHLNLPKSVSIGGGTISYFYDATGVKQRKVAAGTTTDYAGNYIYKGGTLKFFNHPEGYVEYDSGSFNYVYQYKDHLGNIRLSYTDINQNNTNLVNIKIADENNYYPFGLLHKGYNSNPTSYGSTAAKMYKFGGKELQDEAIGGKNLDWYDFQARNYDATLGRWMNVDPLAENGRRWSPYIYAFDNPIYYIDPDGKWPFPSGPINTIGLLKEVKKVGEKIITAVENSSYGGFSFYGKDTSGSGDKETIRKGGRETEMVDVSGFSESIAFGPQGPRGGKAKANNPKKKSNFASKFGDGVEDGGKVTDLIKAGEKLEEAANEISNITLTLTTQKITDVLPNDHGHAVYTGEFTRDTTVAVGQESNVRNFERKQNNQTEDEKSRILSQNY
jgi:RHS repeat-associated protein